MLQGKRILVTQTDAFMGPVLCDVLEQHGASVVRSTQSLVDPGAAAQVVADAGEVHVLVANLAIPAPSSAVADVGEDEWRETFAALVDPLPRLLRAVLPRMTQRGAGRIIVMGSASALRGMKRTSTYSAARGAQLAWAQAVGVELAPQGIQVNAIAQNFVDSPTCRPIRAFRSASSAKCRSVVSSARTKTPSSSRICAATPPRASWGRCFRCAADGYSANAGPNARLSGVHPTRSRNLAIALLTGSGSVTGPM